MSQFSLVIPIYNERESCTKLAQEIFANFDAWPNCPCREVIFVDDGSQDDSAAQLIDYGRRQFGDSVTNSPPRPHLRVLQHSQNAGQSAAFITGVKAARGEWIMTMDGDGQNDPGDMKKLWQARQEHDAQLVASGETGFVMIVGHRRHRRDGIKKKITSVLGNFIRQLVLRDHTPDTGCSLKIFPRAAFLSLPAFKNMHRFIPALMIAQGGKVFSVAVNHRPRNAGRSKYGFWDRAAAGSLDLFGVMWLRIRLLKPGHIREIPLDKEP